MTLNSIIAFICVILPYSIDLQVDYVTLVEDIVYRISSSTFGQNWLTLRRGLSEIADTGYLFPRLNDALSRPCSGSFFQSPWLCQYSTPVCASRQEFCTDRGGL